MKAIMDDSTNEWRRQLEHRVCELERDLAIARIRGATKVDVSESGIRTIKWVACALAFLLFLLLFGVTLAKL